MAITLDYLDLISTFTKGSSSLTTERDFMRLLDGAQTADASKTKYRDLNPRPGAYIKIKHIIQILMTYYYLGALVRQNETVKIVPAGKYLQTLKAYLYSTSLEAK